MYQEKENAESADERKSLISRFPSRTMQQTRQTLSCTDISSPFDIRRLKPR
jgi:hypothetical protein